MTYLLQGGPRHGELVVLDRNVFKISHVVEITDKRTGKTTCTESGVYSRDYGATGSHPDRKRPVKVFRHEPGKRNIKPKGRGR